MNLKNKHKAVLRSCKEYTAIDAGTRWTLGADTGYVLMNEWPIDLSFRLDRKSV